MASKKASKDTRPPNAEGGGSEHLLRARALMQEALAILDRFSTSAAAADLDLALHRLDRELEARQSCGPSGLG